MTVTTIDRSDSMTAFLARRCCCRVHRLCRARHGLRARAHRTWRSRADDPGRSRKPGRTGNHSRAPRTRPAARGSIRGIHVACAAWRLGCVDGDRATRHRRDPQGVAVDARAFGRFRSRWAPSSAFHLGVWSATHRNEPPDYFTRLASLLACSIPPFVLAVLLLLAFLDRASALSPSSAPSRAGSAHGFNR